MDQQLFDETETGARRSVLFAITVATGALCFVSATSVVVSGASTVWALPLAALGIGVLVFGGYLQQGHFEELVEDDEFLWQQN
ncbi:hypothetical protein [Haloarcula salinisoli]|uniref:Uncharacterized protein n=1 Tax=Haloarcula salinisoli TaxID=2487746 RepID=A0A8J7YMZ1_9EURY|nr:hypothetical protein [Halomicroarcula salinisoli]MBX0287792.1 hypothetical protein [Halomicroarcula salinisoli]MBX0304716.1 hypothetical protein [Halomicroarcula salinisoli]